MFIRAVRLHRLQKRNVARYRSARLCFEIFEKETLERRDKFVFDPRINTYELNTVCLKELSVHPMSALLWDHSE